MIYAILAVLGLCFGSFVNALVWRLHEQSLVTSRKSRVKKVRTKDDKLATTDLSILHGRSMCPNCKHELAPKDLLPVVSWLWLKGKCRYCKKPISPQYPLVEAATAGLFILSYVFWPLALHGLQVAVFGLWLIILIGLIALLVYDVRWMLLPNKLIFPLGVIAAAMQLVNIIIAADWHVAIVILLAVAVGGGLFYILFQVSNGRWIGGGDVKLGFLLGLIVGTAEKSLLFIFLAAVLGSLVSLPLLVQKKLGAKSSIPFGPFLIIGGIVTVLFGNIIIHWYNHVFLLQG